MEALQNEGFTPEERKKSAKKAIVQLVVWLVVAVFLGLGAYFFTTNFIAKWPIEGSSMNPTIENDDFVLLFKTKNVKYNDVIIFFSEEIDGGKNLIKRVIGKEGDVIKTAYDEETKSYHVYRNGELLPEDKILTPMFGAYGWKESEVVVPEGKLYVLGDNRNNSLDSSEGYFADKKNIVGKAFIRIKHEDNSISFIH